MKRAFIVGNGPSLSNTPLDRLIGEVSFATNRINLIYDQTDWRPTHYVRAEGLELLRENKTRLWMEEVVYHIEHKDVTTWMNSHYPCCLQREGVSVVPDTLILPCQHYRVNFYDEKCPVYWHLPMLCSFGSSLHVAIQIAVTLGYGPLYLIGCDLGYVDGEPSHFTPDYEVGYEGLLRPAQEANNDMLVAHLNARRSSPVPIYNASIGGNLEVYERVDYNALFRSGSRPQPDS